VKLTLLIINLSIMFICLNVIILMTEFIVMVSILLKKYVL